MVTSETHFFLCCSRIASGVSTAKTISSNMQQSRKRRYSTTPLSWKERVAVRFQASNDQFHSPQHKGKRLPFQLDSWTFAPACVFVALLIIIAAPLHWGSGFRAPSEQLRLSRFQAGNVAKHILPKNEDPAAIHIVMIFDDARMNFTVAAMRSISFYAKNPIVYHMLTPTAIHEEVKGLSDTLLGTPSIRTYDMDLCQQVVAPVWFMAKRIHVSAMCKIFLADILPEDVSRVLYVDSDTTVVNDISLCSFHSAKFDENQFIGMGVDMGESCQLQPDLCFPIGFEWVIPQGLECGTVPFRSKLVRENGHVCRSAGDIEPYQYNGGVMLMDLSKMRAQSFTTTFALASLQTWGKLGHVQATWGEQDMINNFFRFYPKILYPLDCGCNYQFSAARRESKCANHTVVVAHGWSRQMNDRSSRDRFNMHFNFFRFENPGAKAVPPEVFNISVTSPDWANGTTTKPRHTISCSQQSHHCSSDDFAAVAEMKEEVAVANVPASMALSMPTVYILSRTSGRPAFFKEMAESVREQTYPNIVHLVVTDDKESMDYLKDIPEAALVKSLADGFHPEEVCERCGSLGGGASCAGAPSLENPEKRQEFFNCYCNTSYPMNDYMNNLQARVEDGWVMYLDDDNLLQDKYAVSELMAHAQSTDELVAFRSTLGRVTPHDMNFGKRVVMGDFDSSNFMFHSDHLESAKWPDTRCGDFKVGSQLSSVLPVRWVNQSFIQSNPLRDAIGGLGKRQDSQHAGVTVIITSYMTTGWRPQWVKEIIETYLSDEMSSLVAKVILVWNNVDENVPSAIPDPKTFDGRLVIIRPKVNSLNNRWVETLKHIDNEEGSVLNLDDDLYTTREGLICMLNWHGKEPTRMVAPFVRRIAENHEYVMDELRDGSEYSVVLPRVMLLPVKYLRAYASSNYTAFRTYVDEQEAHCDDILMNSVALKESNIPPLRVLLPERSIVDFYSSCWSENKNQTGGLGLQTGRTEKRSECVKDIMDKAKLENFKSSLDVATCLPRGNALVKRRGDIPPQDFASMAVSDVPCGPGEA